MPELRRLKVSNQNNHEELEQYGRRLCLRTDSVYTKTDESSDDVLGSVKSLFKEAKVDISKLVFDCSQNWVQIFKRFLK